MNNKKPRILIVDDVSSNIHLLMNILKDKYTLMAATSGQKALELIKKEPMPDMVLLDVMMPDIDGYEVCRQIKNDERTAHIAVIFVTSLNKIEEQEEGLKIGAIDFITKPFSKDIVLHKIDTYININKSKNEDEIPCKGRLEQMNNEKATILVVDDSPENIQVMIELLKTEYIVSVATSAKKALEMLDDGLNADLILLDVIMPEMNGYELCEVLSKSEEYNHVPVIFVTILEHEKDIVKGFELGAVDYVVKPIEPIVLKARIKTHLKLKQYKDRLLEDLKTKEELILSQSKLAILGEMFENITHQWKQPLSSISVTTSGIKIQKEYDQLNDELLLNGLVKIEESIKYLSHTVDDFRNFLANDSQKHEFNLKFLVDKTLSLLESKFKDTSIEVKNCIEDNIQITNYENDLMQVLMNLFSNAQDALMEQRDSQRLITIISKSIGNEIIICVQDNAGGIDTKNMDFIFNKYFSTKNYKDGSGVGLFMSRKIAQERLGGDIEAHNIDNGACFDIKLPNK